MFVLILKFRSLVVIFALEHTVENLVDLAVSISLIFIRYAGPWWPVVRSAGSQIMCSTYSCLDSNPNQTECLRLTNVSYTHIKLLQSYRVTLSTIIVLLSETHNRQRNHILQTLLVTFSILFRYLNHTNDMQFSHHARYTFKVHSNPSNTF